MIAHVIHTIGQCTLSPGTLSGTLLSSLAETIVYQQLSGKAAGTIFQRFVALYPEQDFPTANNILATPDEVLRQVGLVSEHYQRLSTLQETEVIATRYRMKRSDGEWCWICSLAPLLSTVHGFPLQILGVVQVITPSSCSQHDALSRHPEFSQN